MKLGGKARVDVCVWGGGDGGSDHRSRVWTGGLDVWVVSGFSRPATSTACKQRLIR